MADWFLSCDWGTTHFRLRLVNRATAEVHSEERTDDGVGKWAKIGVKPDERAFLMSVKLQFQAEMLLGEANVDARPPIVISGMASSSIGWRELLYAALPFRLDGSSVESRDVGPLSEGADHRVLLISGARDRLDVMRGEETEAIGLAELLGEQLPNEVVVIKPGTHSKHLRIQNRAIVSFQTFMTGELFEVLRRHSVLQHTTSPEAIDFSQPDAWQADFVAGVQTTQSLGMSAALFHGRTRQLLDGCSSQANTAFLSGVLIGAELGDLQARLPDETPLLLCAGAQMSPAYQCAAATLGLGGRLSVVPPDEVDRLSILGQRRILNRQ